jgi:hypothetical protein
MFRPVFYPSEDVTYISSSVMNGKLDVLNKIIIISSIGLQPDISIRNKIKALAKL